MKKMMRQKRWAIPVICLFTVLTVILVAMVQPGAIKVTGSSTRVIMERDGTYRVSFNGGITYSPSLECKTDIKLRNLTFDPSSMRIADAIPQALRAGSDNSVYIVQYITQALEAYQNELESLGATIYKPLAEQALIVEMNENVYKAIQQLPYVRWIGAYHPAYRLDEEITAGLLRGDDVDVQKYSIMLPNNKPELIRTVCDKIRTLGGDVLIEKSKSSRIEVLMNKNELAAVMGIAGILFIDKGRTPQNYVNLAREISGQAYLESVEGYKGEGVRGEIMDQGMLSFHGDFLARPPIAHGIFGFNVAVNHGTACFSINFGDGSGNADARGIVSGGQGIFSSYRNLESTDRLTHTEELVDPAGTYRCVFQSNSWGWGTTSAKNYSTYAAEIDDVVFNTDILIAQAMGNHATLDATERLALAKNVLSVGGIWHYNTLSKDDDYWDVASTGHASDGRIKPDVCHFFDKIAAGDAQGGYLSFAGTSASTPLVAGFSGILYQMWADGVFDGGPGKGRDVFESRPHFSTIKALLINTASPYAFSNPLDNLSRDKQGYGIPDLKALYTTSKANNWTLPVLVNEDAVIKPLESHVYKVNVVGDTSFRATLVYNDPQGVPSAAQHRINDLSLKVTSPGGLIYWGNHGLLEGNVSKTGGAANSVDTVENVFIDNPEKGIWTVEVSAPEVVEDSHRETAELDADYALVVTTLAGGTVPTPTPTATPTATPTGTPVYENIALGKPAKTSANFGPDFSGEAAVDGNTATAWGSALDNEIQWIYVDLGDVMEIDGVGFKWFDKYYAQAYEVYISNDAKTWHKALTQNNGNGGIDQYYATGTCRYVALLCKKRNSAAYGLAEFEIYKLKM